MKYVPDKPRPETSKPRQNYAKQRRDKRREELFDALNRFAVYAGVVVGIVGPKILQNYRYGATTLGDLQIPNWIDVVVSFITAAGMVSGFEYTPGSPEAKALAKLGKKKNFWRRFVFAVSLGAGSQGIAGPII
jgi:hypothetical protein